MFLAAKDPVVCTSQRLKALGPPRVSPLAVEFSGRAIAVARTHQWLCGQETHTNGTGGEEEMLQKDYSGHM